MYYFDYSLYHIHIINSDNQFSLINRRIIQKITIFRLDFSFFNILYSWGDHLIQNLLLA
jgi:hypothetical protein